MRNAPPKKRESGFFAEVWIALNDLRDYAQELAISPAGCRGLRASRTSNGTLLVVDQERGTDSGSVKQFKIYLVQDDYYVCREFDGVSDGTEDIKVARPHTHRKTGWHGLTTIYSFASFPGSPGQLPVTFNYLGPTYRTASATISTGPTVDHEIILPPLGEGSIYGSVIFACKPQNGTGVSEADEWLDMNTDGRAWARVA